MNKEFLGQLPPQDRTVSDVLEAQSNSIQVNPQFQSNLEARLKQAHSANKQPGKGVRTRILPAIGWAILIIGAILLLNWAVRSLAPDLQPAAGKTAVPTVTTVQTIMPSNESAATPIPPADGYDWRGTTLYLGAALPESPSEARVYQLQPDQQATIESARALAQRFGIQGEVYQAPGELPDTTQFLVTDGKQRLYVRSEQYFLYYADYAHYSTGMFSFQEPLQQDEAANDIDGFLKSHGFDFAYQIENAPQLINDYYVVPLSPDGFPVRHDYLMPVRLEIKLDSAGQVIFLQSGLIAYEPIGTFGIRTAQEAWERVLHENGAAGMQEGMRGGGILKEYFWQRTYPENQAVTIYGRANSFPPADPAGAPFLSIGDQTVAGNIAGLEAIEGNRLVEASGQFFTENSVRTFQVDSWKLSDAVETAVSGRLQREGDQLILSTQDGSQYRLTGVPSDVPLDTQSPGEDLNIEGVLVNGALEWTTIQNFPADSMSGGGGGGGGGLGFYKLNLTGTPVPLPTPEIPQETNAGTGNYVVQEGDTLGTIAEAHAISIDQLMQLNGLTDPTIFIGQTLIVPNTEQAQSPVGQRIEGQRGILMVSIYRKQDGSQRTEYSFVSSQTNQYGFFRLEGPDLGELEKYHNRPVDIWGEIESVDSSGVVTLNVDRYEVPYPDLQYQILKGTQQLVDVQGQQVVVFTSDNGKAYVQFTGYGDPDSSGIIGNLGDEVLLEALLIPDETFGGYPVVRIMGASMAVNPKNGQPVEMTVTADQPNIIDESQIGPDYTPPTATIEKVELVYYTTDPRYKLPDSASEPAYLQPVWRFYGHYSSGDEFEVLVQALKDEFLLPEVETVQPPG
jgi:LysM repeat protein